MSIVSPKLIGLDAMDYVSTGVCIIDRERRVLYWNSCLEDWTGITRQAIQGMHIGERFPHFKSPLYDMRIAEIFSGGAPVVLSSHLHRVVFPTTVPNGPKMIQQTTIRAVPTEERGVYHALFSVEDVTNLTERITELRRAKQALRTAKDQADQANKAKSQFLANMSHEIRTPVNAIMGFSEFLAEEDLTPDQLSDVHTIQRSTKDLLSVINDILDFSKIEAGELDVERVGCPLTELLNSVDALVRVQGKTLDFRIIAESDLPSVIQTDPTRLRQCLMYLMGNALKFTESGHVHLKLSMIVVDLEPCVQFAVEDSGIGIAPDKLNSIFASFTQADGSTTRQYGGTGLGLTITRQLAELMGGTLEVTSELGRGSTFALTIPTRIDVTQSASWICRAGMGQLHLNR